MKRIFLVACSAGKDKADMLPACDLYNSQLFKLARRYAEMSRDPWFILSAKFGLLHPAQLVAPYDESLNDKRSSDRAEWGRMVESQLIEKLLCSTEVVMLAGRAYRDPLRHLLEAKGHTVMVPMEGMAIGKQLQFLTKHVDGSQRRAGAAW